MTTFPFALTLRVLGVSALLGAAITPLWAQSSEGSADKPLWEIGVVGGALTQQAYPGSDQRVNRALALPYVIYRGEYLRADRNSVGLRAIKTENFELDVGLSGALGTNSKPIDARQGMPALGTMVELGPRAKWNLGETPGWGRWRAELPVRGVFDLSNQAAFRGVSVEPKLAFEGKPIDGWRYGLSASVVLADCKLATTLYEVNSAQAMVGRPAYDAKAGLITTRLAATFSKPLTPDLTFFGYARFDSVAGAANEASPLVRRKAGSTVGIGVVYTLMRSDKRASD